MTLPRTAFKKGQSGNPAGRKKGEPDIRTKVWSVKESLERAGYDPIDALINIARDEDMEHSVRLKANIELTSRIAPLLKQIDQNHSGGISVDIPGLTAKLTAQIAAAKERK